MRDLSAGFVQRSSGHADEITNSLRLVARNPRGPKRFPGRTARRRAFASYGRIANRPVLCARKGRGHTRQETPIGR
jgi:hypothetical protein